MKRKLLPLLIAGIAAASANVALAGAPTVYGKVNVTLNKNDFENIQGGAATSNKDNWTMESNASRLGVAGDWDISSGLKAVYKLEYEIITTADKEGDNGSDFKQRNTYAGLQGSWGTLVAGRNDSPLKAAQDKVDQFNDLPNGDIKNYLTGENRMNNMLMYSTPSMSGFGVTLAVAPGEDSGTTSNQDDGLADHVSAALTYSGGPLYLALAVDNNVENTDIVRVVGEYKIGPVALGALYQTAEANDEDNGDVVKSPGVATDFASANKEQDGFVLSIGWSITSDMVLKGQYGQSTTTPTDTTLDDSDATQYAIGLDYKLDKNSMIFAYYSAVDVEGDTTLTDDTVSDKTFGVGYELKF